MQTFLPYPSFVVSAMCLDTRRLGKQRVEARQIQSTLQGRSDGWSSHPAVRMWEGSLLALMLYGDCMIREWVRRGYQNTMPLMLVRDTESSLLPLPELTMPTWLGDPELHASHRSRLLMKDPEWYGRMGWDEEPGRDYRWPV